MRSCMTLLTILLSGATAACVPPEPGKGPAPASMAPTRALSPAEPTAVSAEPRAAPPAPFVPLARPVRLAPKDRTCLVAAMYHEAHGEGDEGMAAVGHVVLNRLSERPAGTGVCDVVYERGQFGWTRRVSRKHVAIGRTRSWQNAAALADRLIAGKEEDATGGATSFSSVLEFRNGPPPWAEAQQETARIGNHVFIVP